MTSTSMTARCSSTPTTPTRNFRLCTAPLDAPGEWTELIAPYAAFLHDRRRVLRAISSSSRGGEDGLDQIEIHRYDDADAWASRSPFPRRAMPPGSATIPNTTCTVLRRRLRVDGHARRRSTITTSRPARSTTLKVQEIPSRLRRARNTRTERLEIAARDGTEIPVSIVYPQGLPARRHRRRSILYAYGAYGYAIPPGFSTTRLSPARPRLRLCHRAYPRRRRSGPAMVSRRQARKARPTPSTISSMSRRG